MSGQTDAKSEPLSSKPVKQSLPNKLTTVNQRAIGNPLWAVPLADLAATRNRPLFSPSRRPPPPAVTVAPSAPPPRMEPEKPPLVLVGTVVSETEAIAVFRDQSTKRVITLRSGESRYGWLLGGVHKTDVVLQKDSSSVLLSLSAHPTAAVTIAMQEHPRLERRQR